MDTYRILVVDDEHEILRIIDDLLSKSNYKVDTATSSEKALNLLNINQYQTILTDIRMPEKSGIDLLKIIKDKYPELPVIFMTGYASVDSAVKSLKHGAFDYLIKPLDYEYLKSLIKHSIEIYGLRKQKNELIDKLKAANLDLENKVKERNRQLTNILNSTKESIITTDRDLNVITANPVTKEIFGKDCSGTNLKDLLHGINYNSITPNVLNNHSYSTRHEIKYNDRYLDITISQLIDFETQNIMGLIVVIQDITEKKKLEAQVVQSAKMSSVGQLAAGIAHEFNNILTSIIGYTNLAQSRSDIYQIHNDLNIVEQASERAADIVNKLLNFSRSKEDKYELVLIDELIEDTVVLIEATFESSNIKILRYYDKIPPVRMNKSEIQQVILNLLINSKHAIKNGGVIKIKTEIHDDYLLIEIADSGSGISKDNINKIFEPFFTTKNGEDSERGTGLGLSVVYAIIERHNGKIEVLSEENRGATFLIKLPNIQRVKNTDYKISNQRNDINQARTNRKGNILIIDDDVSICNVLKEYLSMQGHNVVVSSDPLKALKNFDKCHFDIVFVDYNMPQKNGLDLLREIKMMDYNTIVVIITGKADDSLKNNYSSLGAFSLVYKPFSMDKIQDMISQILGANDMQNNIL